LENVVNMSTSAKTRLTWSLAILLALATIATSVSYVVSAHQAEAQNGSHGLRQIALITGPGIPPRGLWAFDISFVDDQSQVDYLADASNASVDLIDTRTNTLIGQIGGFRGFHGSRETQGPGGVLMDDLGQLWTSDGDSTVKLIDLSSRTIVATLRTGGMKRADEMAYDPQDQLLVVTNGSETVPFATFISVTKRASVGKLVFEGADGGLEAPVFDAETHRFYLSVPANKRYPGGAVAVVDPLTRQLVREYPLPACDPSGIALDPANQDLLLGCAGHPVIVSALSGQVVATILQTSGCDEVWYDRGDQRFYLAAFTNPSGPLLSVVDATTGAWVENVPTMKKAHSVAVDPLTNHIFVPETGRGIVVYAQT
jgi:DNA-binding beta-propeller fold protein YncE